MHSNETKPLISIITVSYNAIDVIEKTILSVINQTYPNIEYIIIDGGSTDGTVDIIKKYTDKISYWISEPDKGIYDAMNKGIHIAKGKWINFMNCGDSFYDDMVIEKVINEANLASDIIYGNTNLSYSFGNYILRGGKISQTQYMPFCHQSSFTKIELIKQIGFDIKYKICADKNFFYISYNNNAKFEYIDIIISNYEAESGFSANNLSQVTYEKGVIEGKNNNFLWKLKYYFILFYCKVVNLIKEKLPRSIIRHIKIIKIKHQILNN